ncbi:hypothetical protein GGI20_006186, partial [Coemansia sp. BCRC 34301]
MGHPGARVYPPLPYRRDTHLGITRHSTLHKQLLLVPTPNPSHSQALVGRLSVVRPSSDDVIVVEAKRPGAESPSSVEAIYQVIGSRIVDPRLPSLLAAGRPIAIPKSRLGKLRPAQRSLPTSREVVEAGPVYTRDGSLRARRPASIVLMAEEATNETLPPAIEVTDSYCNDVGYDLVRAEIDSLYCRSFDIDMLPDAPERKLSFYNIGVKEVPVKEEEVVRPHRTLGIASDGLTFAKPRVREANTDFYNRVLTLRSPTSQQQHVSPVSPVKTLPDHVVSGHIDSTHHHHHHHHRFIQGSRRRR